MISKYFLGLFVDVSESNGDVTRRLSWLIPAKNLNLKKLWDPLLTTNGKLGLYKISLRPGHRIIALSNNPTVQCDEHAPHRPIHMAIHDNHVWKNRQLDFGNLPITSYYCSNRSAYLCTTVTYIETCRNSLSPKVRQGYGPLHQNTTNNLNSNYLYT